MKKTRRKIIGKFCTQNWQVQSIGKKIVGNLNGVGPEN
jgi:hypothetical protein